MAEQIKASSQGEDARSAVVFLFVLMVGTSLYWGSFHFSTSPQHSTTFRSGPFNDAQHQRMWGTELFDP